MSVILGFMLGFLLAVVISFVRTLMQDQRDSPNEEYARFLKLRHETLQDIRRVVPKKMLARAK
jgi:hypothetical protein